MPCARGGHGSDLGAGLEGDRGLAVLSAEGDGRVWAEALEMGG